MTRNIKTDICVLGAGSGGLSVAAGTSQMGADTVLVEKALMGGDCLNTGCVPSKALLAAGHAADAVRRGGIFGVDSGEPKIDAARVFGHVHDTIASIAPHDSVERFEGLGVKVIQAAGSFSGPNTLTAGDAVITARRFVIATGSSAAVPPIPGLDTVPYMTNENVFEQTSIPDHLIVIGGGPIGIEMAQAHRHLGARVTVLEMFSILPKDEPELVEVLRRHLAADGIDLREGVSVDSVEKTQGGVAAIITENGETVRIEGSHILVAAGRRPNVDGLGLGQAGVTYSPKGIPVDARLRTSNKKIFAIGDVTGGFQFTHMAGYHAGIVIRNALFRLPAKVKTNAVPWVTYTTPEVAQVGMTEAEARKVHGDGIRVLDASFADNDRARAEKVDDGLIKVIVSAKGRILGAGIAGPHAGELIQSWVLAVSQNLKIGAMASIIAPYPTLGEISKRAAGSYYTPRLFSEKTRRIVRFLRIFG